MILPGYTERERLDVLLSDIDFAMAEFAREPFDRATLLQVHGAEGVAEGVRRAAYPFDTCEIAYPPDRILDTVLPEGLAIATDEDAPLGRISGPSMVRRTSSPKRMPVSAIRAIMV